APAEAEAQAAHMVKQSKAWAVASQDADTLLFGAPRLARNLSASQRRRQGLGTRQTPPELVELSVMLEQQGLTQEQLILLGMLIGTDYNQGGIKGIGPKKALKLVKEHVTGDGVSDDGRRALFAAVKWEEYFEQDWHDVYTLLAHPAVTDDYSLAWKAPDKQAVLRILVGQHEFSLERIEASLAKMTPKQRGLDAFF
ncbi:flap structure-specific endonuclease, partial [Candidatus Woesearchaeota archaeon CG_4_10_14_0_2_um_filter_57_5]